MTLFAKIIIVFLLLVLLITMRVMYLENKGKEENKRNLIGEYRLNMIKTNFGTYEGKKYLYKELRVTFKQNQTFEFNMKVPFIFDTYGTWKPSGRGIYDWNKFYFRDNEKLDIEGSQVDNCCLPDSNIIFTTTKPRKGEKNIPEIYFRKIAPQR